MYYQWAPYVPVAERRRQAAAEMNKLKKKGHPVSPVVIAGRAIASTAWGKAWCDNLESYSDFANRLPRGRTYVRNGSVVDLQIGEGRVDARVSGSSLYRTTITVAPLPAPQWKAIRADCAGGIDSLVELLQGRLAGGVMQRLCRQGDGLFPTPKQVQFSCSCPDGAWMCKHVAAVLYGVGSRLDHRPELLFTLRGIDPAELIAEAGAGLGRATAAAASDRVLASDDLGALFDVDLDTGATKPAAKAKAPGRPAKGRSASTKASAGRSADKARPSTLRQPAASASAVQGRGGRRPAAAAAAPARGGSLSTRLQDLLKRQRSLTSAQAQAALGASAADLRPLLQRLVVAGQATVSGRTRGTIYHAVP